MKINYTGRQAELTEAEKSKAERRFAKIHKILSAERNLEANVVLSRTRHTCEAEVTLRALQHTLVVTGANAQPFAALTAALEKLEKQAVKNKHKLVDTRRPHRQRDEPPPAVEAVLASQPDTEAEEPKPNGPRIVRGNGMLPKPATVEEATIHLEESNRDQVTFRHMETGAVCVLLRRRDGDLELVDTTAS